MILAVIERHSGNILKTAGDLGVSRPALYGLTRRLSLHLAAQRPEDHPPFDRKNGNCTLTLTALNATIGFPYGTVSPLLLAWISTKIVRTKSKTLPWGVPCQSSHG
jgi:hypothetical protein